MAWLYIAIAAIAEVCWIYSLKYMEFKKLLGTSIIKIVTTHEGLLLLLPVALYIVFGLINIVFFSKAMQTLPASLAFAIWMAISLVGVKLTDVLLFKESLSYLNLFFLLLILTGIIGIKLS